MSQVIPGTIIGGRYKVIRELNRGGTAVVYEGTRLDDGSIVALKVMSVKDGKALVPIKGVKREIQNAASIQHDNIVKLVDFVADDKQIVIVWELIVGPDLLDLLNEKGGRLQERLAAFYFGQLLQGVAFIHAHGLCHRDLKPENCMIERASNKLKIIDFGLSKHQQSAVTLGIGTVDYMSPELLGNTSAKILHERHVGQYDARAVDVWAMGVLLYLLVTGQYPFEDPHQPQNVVATLQNIANGRIRPYLKRVTPECSDLIARLLTKDPNQRITLHAISQHPWLLMNDVHVAIHPPPLPHHHESNALTTAVSLSPAAGISIAQQQHEDLMIDQVMAEFGHKASFSFDSQQGSNTTNNNQANTTTSSTSRKPTPATPRILHMNAHISGDFKAPNTAAMPSRSTSGGGRDQVLAVVKNDENNQTGTKRARLSDFCRLLWKG